MEGAQVMDHDLTDAQISSEKNLEKTHWSLIPALTLAGFSSAVFSGSIWYSAISTGSNTLFVILASLSFGLAIGAALWFYRFLQGWTKLGTIVGVTLATHLLRLYGEPHLPSQWQEWIDFPVVGSIEPAVAVQSFGVALILFFAVLVLTTRKAKTGWTLAIALACASMEAATVAAVDGTQRGAWFSFLRGNEFGLIWQPCLGFFLAVALVLKSRIARFHVPAQEKPKSSFTTRFAALGILLVYWGIGAAWDHSFQVREGKRIRDSQAREMAELAKSHAETPAFERLPSPVRKPLEEVLLLQEINGWKPYFSGSQEYPVQRDAPFPERRAYYARYSATGNSLAVDANVTEYPNAEWAKYSVRNTPTPDELIKHPDWVKHLVKSGNNIFQEGPYFFWASDRKLILLNCSGALPDVIDEFLKAYLAKYPSSL